MLRFSESKAARSGARCELIFRKHTRGARYRDGGKPLSKIERLLGRRRSLLSFARRFEARDDVEASMAPRLQ
jgi:hypothetical protein